MAPVGDAPTNELGNPGVLGPTRLPLPTGRTTTSYAVDSLEETPEQRFPESVRVYDRMRRTDGQTGSVLRAITLAVLSARRRLNTDDVRPEVAELVRSELGLEEEGTGRRRRRRQGIVWKQHLREALAMLPLGFMPFEQVFEIAPPLPGQTAPPGSGGYVTHLRKLAARPPRSIMEVRVARDGGLAGITQNPLPMDYRTAGGPIPGISGIPIDVDRLVYYVNDREGADWYGNSILRTAYASWLIKDRLRRLGPMVIERNGMGLPVVTYDPAVNTRTQALEVARQARAGEEAGVALPAGDGGGMSLTLMGVQGQTRDELPLLKYHDEEIGRSALTMFLNLGHDNGARALGDTFLDFFLLAGDVVNDYLDEVGTEHVIRDLVEYNYGPDEPYPVLESDPLADDAVIDAGALKSLADAGLITPDRPTEANIRRRYKLPPQADNVSPADGSPSSAGDDPTSDPDALDPAQPPRITPAPPMGSYTTLAARLENATRTLAAMAPRDDR